MPAELVRLLDRHLERLRALNAAPATVRSRSGTVRRFLRWLESEHRVTAPEALRTEHLRRWQLALARQRTAGGRPLKPRSVNKAVGGVRRFLADLADGGHVSRQLADVPEYVKVPVLLPRALRHETVRAILEGIDDATPEGNRDRAMLELLYSSGLRAAELLGADLDSIDFEHGVIRVVGKGPKERIVPVGATALRLLEGYVRAVRPELVADPTCPALFTDRFGRRLPYHTLRRIVLRIGANAGLDEPLTCHVFRRSCASELVRGRANLYHVSLMLGHESPDTLKHYVRLDIADIRETHRRTHPRERDERARDQ